MNMRHHSSLISGAWKMKKKSSTNTITLVSFMPSCGFQLIVTILVDKKYGVQRKLGWQEFHIGTV